MKRITHLVNMFNILTHVKVYLTLIGTLPYTLLHFPMHLHFISLKCQKILFCTENKFTVNKTGNPSRKLEWPKETKTGITSFPDSKLDSRQQFLPGLAVYTLVPRMKQSPCSVLSIHVLTVQLQNYWIQHFQRLMTQQKHCCNWLSGFIKICAS